jgi:hypothetical protein
MQLPGACATLLGRGYARWTAAEARQTHRAVQGGTQNPRFAGAPRLWVRRGVRVRRQRRRGINVMKRLPLPDPSFPTCLHAHLPPQSSFP